MNIWDKTKPLPSEYINTFYDYLTNLKELFLDRFGLDHNMDGVLDTSLATADGYHKHLTMRDYEDSDGYGNTIITPIYTEDSQQLFVKKIDGLHELCCQNAEGIYYLTSGGHNKLLYDEESLGYLSSIFYLNNLFIDIRSDFSTYVNQIYTSSDGINYSLINNSLPAGRVFTMIYFNGLYYVFTDQQKVYFSSTLYSWTLFGYSSDCRFLGIAGTNLVVIAYISTTLYVFTSPDGSNWTQRNSLGTITRYAQCGTTLLCLNSSSVLYKSTDGINWSSSSFPYNVNGYLFYFNNRLIYTYGDVISYSTDMGVSWNFFSGFTFNSLYIIGFVSNRFIGVNTTAEKKLYESRDLITWEVNQTNFSIFTYNKLYIKIIPINNKLIILMNNPTTLCTKLTSRNYIG